MVREEDEDQIDATDPKSLTATSCGATRGQPSVSEVLKRYINDLSRDASRSRNF